MLTSGRITIRPYKRMIFDPYKHRRHSTRLKGYDYSSSGYYFITICTKNNECILNDIVKKKMCLNEFGEVVKTEWIRSFVIRKEMECDKYVIMPNHIHAIILIAQHVGANGGLPLKRNIISDIEKNNNWGERANCHSPLHMKPRSLSSFVSGFKSAVSRKLEFSLWQRNYFDHIIMNTKELNHIRYYVHNNPKKWERDEYYPKNFDK